MSVIVVSINNEKLKPFKWFRLLINNYNFIYEKITEDLKVHFYIKYGWELEVWEFYSEELQFWPFMMQGHWI